MNPNPTSGPATSRRTLYLQSEIWRNAIVSAGGVRDWIDEGIAPLAYRALSEDALDGELRAELRQAYYQSLSRNIELLDALLEIDRLAGRRAVTLMALKGAALAEEVYGDPGLRPMSDLDLLVMPGDEARAQELLRSLGFRPAGLYSDLHRRGRVVVDLHTDAINRSRIRMRGQAFRVDTAALFDRSGSLSSYAAVVAPSPVDHLLILCIHAFRHGYRRRIWLFDIAEMVARLTPEERDLVPQRFGLAGAAQILDLSEWMVETRLGHRWSERAARRRPAGLPPWFLALADAQGLPQILEPVVTWRILKGSSARVRYLLEAAFPRPEVLAQISGLAGRRTFWLSYPYRCAQLAGMALSCLLALRSMERSPRS